MEASVVDLRYRMKEVLRALECREPVTVLYHGKVKGVIYPAGKETRLKVTDHPFFGMLAKDRTPVTEIMERLRGGRFRAL